jgi:hypothetical protein
VTMTANRVPAAGPPPAVVPPRRSTPRRRSPAMVSLGVILVVLGALGAWRYVGVAASATRAYLAVYTEVPAGSQITQDVLQVVHITPAAGLTPISADDLSTVLGTYAKVTLYPGTLLTADQLTHVQGPGADQALLGLQLQANQRPGRGVQPGSSVMLVALPDPNAASGTVAAAPGTPTDLTTWPATVVGSQEPSTDGSQVVDVVVARTALAAIAGLADQSRIALVLVAGG